MPNVPSENDNYDTKDRGLLKTCKSSCPFHMDSATIKSCSPPNLCSYIVHVEHPNQMRLRPTRSAPTSDCEQAQMPTYTRLQPFAICATRSSASK